MPQQILPSTRILLIAMMVAACAAPVQKQEYTGFLSDYSNLQEKDSMTFLFHSDDLLNYRSFIIDPIEILYVPDEDNRIFSDEELAELQTFFKTNLSDALTRDNQYAVVSEPGPSVARMRYAITHIDDTIGVLNIAMYTKITGAGLGGVAIEGELVDSQSGEQLAATVRWGSGSRVPLVGRAGFTHTGDAKILLARWSKRLRQRLDQLHEDPD